TKIETIIYFLEFIFWMIYVTIKGINVRFSVQTQVIQISLGGIIIFLCIAYAITLSWWAGRLSQNPINNVVNNNTVTERNNAGSESIPNIQI
ncbi:hypothetical protein C1645_794234, partial [Glomus cerebriforme]